MSFSKRLGTDAIFYAKPIDSLKGWNDHFFWVDAFACPTSFPWHTSKGVSKDPFPKPSEYDAGHYAILFVYHASFHKYLKPFFCLVGKSRYYTLDENTYLEFLYDNDQEIDLLSFIRTDDPTKVKIDERKRTKGEPKLLDTIVGRVVPLLPVAPAEHLRSVWKQTNSPITQVSNSSICGSRSSCLKASATTFAFPG
ncbi:hypothetical protein Tco_0952874 [Tanacetum coccineum]|uniref:Uncharacterized protein n=1 Tax=Tanacetum coccineum TaxID=301880 RepID=A0ABQ5E3K0_9ASTR